MTVTLTLDEFQLFTGIAAQLNRIEAAIQQLDKENQKIMATEQDVKTALDKIDQTTTAIGNNLNSEVGTIKAISDDVDQLKAALSAIPQPGVSQALIDQANAIAARLDTVGTNIANQVPVLQAIAQNGQLSAPPPPPPPPPPAGS